MPRSTQVRLTRHVVIILIAHTIGAGVAASGAQAPTVFVGTREFRLAQKPSFPVAKIPPDGIVELALTISPNGDVLKTDGCTGPKDLCAISVSSARNWRFVYSSDLEAKLRATVYFGIAPPSVRQRLQEGVLTVRPPPPPSPFGLVVKSVAFDNVPDEVRRRVTSKLSIRVGTVMTAELFRKARSQVKSIDPALSFRCRMTADGKGMEVRIGP